MSVPSGDPGSCSVAGGSLRRLAVGLRTDTARIQGAYADLSGGWSGQVSVAARRRGDDLLAVTRTLADESDHMGSLLQRHSSDLATLLDEVASLVSGVQAAGFDVTDAGVRLAPGISGEADPAAETAREQVRAALDRRWHDLLDRLASHRAALEAALEESTRRLARAAASLRLS